MGKAEQGASQPQGIDDSAMSRHIKLCSTALSCQEFEIETGVVRDEERALEKGANLWQDLFEGGRLLQHVVRDAVDGLGPAGHGNARIDEGLVGLGVGIAQPLAVDDGDLYNPITASG